MADIARMTTDQLIASAKMHINDPYMMALYSGENARRQAIKPQPQANQQPTVVDQELAKMGSPPQGKAQAMPEDTGIAALPTPNMETMSAAQGGIVGYADGGIVAFAPGGSTGSNAAFVDFLSGLGKTGSDFANADKATQQSLTQAFEAATGGGPKVPVGGIPAGGIPAGGIPAAAASVPFQAAAGVVPGMQYLKGLGRAAMSGAGKLGIFQLGEHLFGTSDQDKRDLAKSDPVYRAELEKQGFFGSSPANSTGTTEASGRSAFPGQGATGTNVPYVPIGGDKGGARQEGADKDGAKQRDTEGGIPKLLTPAAAQQSAAQQYKDIRGGIGNKDEFAAQTQAVGKELIKSKEEALTAIEADNLKFADILKGKEGKLATRASDILRQSDTNTGLAFLNAGFAMMSTPGSLATAIGKGARVGTESFSAGLDKINAAKSKLQEAEDRLDDLKINRAEMSARDVRTAKTGINEAKVTALGMYLDGAKQAGARGDKEAMAILTSSVQLQTNAADNATRMAEAWVTLSFM
mgnify:CR=1 FL=1